MQQKGCFCKPCGKIVHLIRSKGDQRNLFVSQVMELLPKIQLPCFDLNCEVQQIGRSASAVSCCLSSLLPLLAHTMHIFKIVTLVAQYDRLGKHSLFRNKGTNKRHPNNTDSSRPLNSKTERNLRNPRGKHCARRL